VTEAEWLNTENQLDQLKYVRGKASERKLRLFACAVVRCAWKWLIRKRNRQAVETAERFADGLATEAELKEARGRAFDNYQAWGERYDTLRNANITYALQRSFLVTGDDAWKAADFVLAEACNRGECDLLRDVFGNPFRPAPAVDPAWLTWRGGTVPQLARAVYDERRLPEGTLDPARLAVLADALEDASCVDPELRHLRGPGPHARGCWAVDLLLGKS
jgi:hypothetical protein